MYELKKDQLCKVAHLVRGELFPKPEVTSVIEGNNPGWIFVNDLSSPTTAIIWPQGMEGFHFAGDENDKHFLENINEYVDEVLQSRLKGFGFNFFEVSGDNKSWNKTIEKVFTHRNWMSVPNM
ncbi:MAG: GNAT family N-acetyltransferase [Clostridiaceae bacterium]